MCVCVNARMISLCAVICYPVIGDRIGDRARGTDLEVRVMANLRKPFYFLAARSVRVHACTIAAVRFRSRSPSSYIFCKMCTNTRTFYTIFCCDLNRKRYCDCDLLRIIRYTRELLHTCGYELRAMREGKTHTHGKHDGH